MSPVPEKIRSLIMHQAGEVLRKNKKKTISELNKLGISEKSQVYSFFLEFTITLFISTSSYEELVDIAEPTAQIFTGTEFAHEVWGIPEQYICLTSCEGEGCYLYSKETQSVYDFSLAEREGFILNPIPAWETFFEFIEWYLTPVEIN